MSEFDEIIEWLQFLKIPYYIYEIPGFTVIGVESLYTQLNFIFEEPFGFLIDNFETEKGGNYGF